MLTVLLPLLCAQDLWWSTASESLQNTVLMLLSDLPPSSCVFLVVTADCLHNQLPEPLLALFPLETKERAAAAAAAASSSSAAAAAAASSVSSTVSFELHRPSVAQLASFFQPIVDELKREIPRMRHITQMEQLPVLPKAVDAPAAAGAAGALAVSSLTPEQQVAAESLLSPAQLSHKLAHESSLLRLQRMSLRGLLQKLMHSFPDFVYRLNRGDHADYPEVVAEAIALDDLMQSLNEDESFDSVSKFNLKIDLLVNNTKEYSAHHAGKYRSWVNKACHLQDTALSMVAQLDTNLVQQCEIISKRRGIRKAKAQSAAGGSSAAAAVPVRTNLRSQTKASDENAAAASSAAAAAMTDTPASSAAAAAPAAAAASDAPTKMEVDGEDSGAAAEETKVKEEPQAAAAPNGETVPAGASPPPTGASLSSTVAVASSASPDATAGAAASPSASAAAPSSSPIPILLPLPPALELDAARLASLPSQLASTLQGCSVEGAEQVGFQLMKVVVAFQMKPERNQAMDEIMRIAQDNKL